MIAAILRLSHATCTLRVCIRFRYFHYRTRVATPARLKMHRGCDARTRRCELYAMSSARTQRRDRPSLPPGTSGFSLRFVYVACAQSIPPKSCRLLDHPSSRREACGCFASSLVARSPGFPVSGTAEGISRSREIDRVDHQVRRAQTVMSRVLAVFSRWHRTADSSRRVSDSSSGTRARSNSVF